MSPADYWLTLPSDPARRPLLLLHGFLGSKAEWAELMPCLSATTGRTCLAPDLPGHGHNPQTTCSFADTAAQLWRDLETMGIGSVDVLGYSMGARLALYLCGHFPERIGSCVLESGSPGLQSEPERVSRRSHDDKLAQALESQTLKDFLDDWYQQPLFSSLRARPDFEQLKFRRLQENQLRSRDLARSLRQAGTGVMTPLWDILPALKLPLLALAGEQDTKYVKLAHEMALHCPSLQVRVLPGGHCSHLEAPQAWHDAVASFFAVSGPVAGDD